MKRSVFTSALSTLILIGLFGAAIAQERRSGDERGPASDQQVRGGGIVTLYAWDPLARAFCFHDGREAYMVRSERLVKRCTSDMGFASVAGGGLVIGTDANRVGAIIDLGTAEELRARYGFDNDANSGVGFATLRLHGDKLALFVQKEDRPQEKVEFLKEAQTLAQSGPVAAISVGHIYVVRIGDSKDGRTQMMVKAMVLAYTPNETVTIRWEVLQQP